MLWVLKSQALFHWATALPKPLVYITNLIIMNTYVMFTLKNQLFNQAKQMYKFG